MRSTNNIVYWTREPLDRSAIAVLRRIAQGKQVYSGNRLETAYLVARECVRADVTQKLLTITEKGLDALEHYREV